MTKHTNVAILVLLLSLVCNAEPWVGKSGVIFFNIKSHSCVYQVDLLSSSLTLILIRCKLLICFVTTLFSLLVLFFCPVLSYFLGFFKIDGSYPSVFSYTPWIFVAFVWIHLFPALGKGFCFSGIINICICIVKADNIANPSDAPLS